jgi:uncharacterized protein with FMN-binding domain
MRKTLVIIIAVAILGGASLVAKNHNNTSANPSGPPGSSGFTSNPASGSSISASSSSATSGPFKDGTFTGNAADTPYGTVQIAVVISGGKITDVNYLQMPSDQGHSREVTSFSEPLLKQTTIDKQSANIDFVSGATSTSYGYQESLQAALDQAKTS